jgi:hypothetical protein
MPKYSLKCPNSKCRQTFQANVGGRIVSSKASDAESEIFYCPHCDSKCKVWVKHDQSFLASLVSGVFDLLLDKFE